MTEYYQQAAIQDQLLQNYRLIQFTSQSILLLAGAVESCFILTASDSHGHLFGILIVSLTVSSLLRSKIKKAIASRYRDVDYWHQQIINLEQNKKPEERPLTIFKIHQKIRNSVSNTKDVLELIHDETFVNALIDREKGHTRQLMDNKLMNEISLAWIAMVGICALKLVLM